jgi:hypothetical protein
MDDKYKVYNNGERNNYGTSEASSRRVELLSYAAGPEKKLNAKDPPFAESRTMEIPGKEVIALLLIFGLFLSARWSGLLGAWSPWL